ncbi:MAG: PD-(D/E)XK nuclease family protein [Dehalococcoidia bacterium]
MASLRLVPYGARAIEALREAVASAKGGDALAPVTVAVPSNYAGLSLRRKLALEPGGVVNVRFLVLARAGELLGAPSLAARDLRPLTASVRAEAVRAALAEDPGIFRDVAEHTATERSLDATFRELRQAGDQALDALAQRSDRASHVVRLYRGFRARTTAYYDEEDLAYAAAEAVRNATPALRDVGHVVLYLPRRLTPGLRALGDALAATHGLTAIVGLTGDAEADAPARKIATQLERVLGAADEEECPPPPIGTEIVAVSDAEEEVRTALRLVMEGLAAGTPLHRMAVLYPSTQPYALLGHEQFHAAGVPHNGPAVRTLAQTMSGRTLLGLLRLKELDFRRDALMDWLSAAPVLESANGRPAPAHRWDTLSRAAGVVAGAAQWRDRLARHKRSLEGRHAALLRMDEANEWELARIERDVERVGRLAAFVAELAAGLDVARQRTWEDYASWAQKLLERYLGGEGHRGEWPDEEIEAHRSVEEALTTLGALGELRDRTDEATFRRALERELESPAKRVGRFGNGVFIGRIGDALGTEFDAVFVIGMSEGLVPPRSRDDPLLPDRERAGLDDEMPLRTQRRAEDRRDYLAALACAERRTLIFPRADLRGQRGRLPARWLLETASAREGRTLFSADLERLQQPWLRVVPSFEGALADGLEPASEQEYDLRSLYRWRRSGKPAAQHYLALEDPSLRAGLEADVARHGKLFTRWDGRITGASGLVPSSERVVSPTALQNYATCPFRYFLGHVLYVAETERPEDTLTISPMERGNLIHNALERFIKDAPQRMSPEEMWTEEERARLLAIGNELCDDAEAAGNTGRKLLWRLARARIIRDLAGFLDKDEELRAQYGVVPAEVELAFGMRDAEQGPLTLTIDGHTIAFRGRIDRVDRAPDGTRLLVLDYKTGTMYGVDKLAKDPVRRGELLQLPIYGLVAQERYGHVATEAYYWYTSEQTDYERAGYPLTSREMNAFQSAMTAIVGGIGAGAFPARPGKDRTNCTFCAFDAACARDREASWKRKRVAPELQPYLDLAEPED